MAQDAGLQVSALSRIERGQQRASAEQVERIARSLGLTMPEFYGEPPSEAANG